MGIEPTTPGATVQCSDQLSYGHRANSKRQSYPPLRDRSTLERLTHRPETFGRAAQRRRAQQGSRTIDREPGVQRSRRALTETRRRHGIEQRGVELERLARELGERVAIEHAVADDVDHPRHVALDELD